MSMVQVLLLSGFIAFLILENYGYGYWMVSRPIFAGPLIGLVLGDIQTGLLVGGSVELMYMGVIPPTPRLPGSFPRYLPSLTGGTRKWALPWRCRLGCWPSY